MKALTVLLLPYVAYTRRAHVQSRKMHFSPLNQDAVFSVKMFVLIFVIALFALAAAVSGLALCIAAARWVSSTLGIPILELVGLVAIGATVIALTTTAVARSR